MLVYVPPLPRMARRRSEDAEVQNGKKKQEEIDTFQTVYIDTNLDTRLALVASHFDSVLDLKSIDFSHPFLHISVLMLDA